jgi:hypothetical protein
MCQFNPYLEEIPKEIVVRAIKAAVNQWAASAEKTSLILDTNMARDLWDDHTVDADRELHTRTGKKHRDLEDEFDQDTKSDAGSNSGSGEDCHSVVELKLCPL